MTSHRLTSIDSPSSRSSNFQNISFRQAKQQNPCIYLEKLFSHRCLLHCAVHFPYTLPFLFSAHDITLGSRVITRSPSTMAPPSTEQLLTLSGAHFRQMFEAKDLTIAQLVSRAMQQIKDHNKDGLKLNAIISVAPEEQLKERAEQLDRELQADHSRGPLHGIPVILKVNISPCNTTQLLGY